MRLQDFELLGGHMDVIRSIDEVVAQAERRIGQRANQPWPTDARHYRWSERD